MHRPGRTQSFSAASSKTSEKDDEENVVEEITAEDEKRKLNEPEPFDKEIYEDVEEPPPPTA